jgi:hypothetical protein
MLVDILYGHAHPGEYVFGLLCMAAAWMIGRAVATDWENLPKLVFYVLLLGAGARFLHFALYQARFASLGHYAVDTLVFIVVAVIGYRFTRTNQMTRQYHWLYEKASPLSWRERPQGH